jgi:bifunctional ADP-heptose synthase (sugar kinase/adenylyltransferase)
MDWAALIKRFRNLRVLVVGDIILDRWSTYDPSESKASNQTGIPRLGVRKTVSTPGASGAQRISAIATGDPIDTCAAGESFVAGMTLASQAGAGIETAVRFGIMVAGVTIMKPGSGEASPQEVLAVADSMMLL